MLNKLQRKEKICGQIKTVYFAAPTFSAGKLKTSSGKEIKFAGRFFAQKNIPMVFNGQWIDHPKYGEQFSVSNIEYKLNLDSEGLANYLANHPDIKGIGPIKAKIIADKFGHDFEHIITDLPETVAKEAKISLHSANNLRAIWLKNKKINITLTYLASYELTHLQMMNLINKLGNNAVGILKENPYIIVKEIRGMGFKRVDQIALKMGIAKEKPERIRAGILHCLTEALDQGDCWVEEMDLIDRANTLLIMDCMDSRDRISKELDYLLKDKQIASPGFDGRFMIAKPEIYNMEVCLAEKFKQGKQPNPHIHEKNIDAFVKLKAPELNDSQHKAVVNSLKYRISLISGGAGSGKSFTAAYISNLCEENGLFVTLAAPTGKAAKRLEQLVNRSAFTIHRLLGFDGKNYSKGPDDPIEADVIIVDETSMIPVPLAWRLFNAINLNRTVVVLIGDHNQLPPIGPGNVLRDLINSRVLPTTILEKIIRHAGVLKENCRAILNGEVKKTCEPDQTGKKSWYLVNHYLDQMRARQFILHLYANILAERLSFDIVKDVQLLTPTHKGPLGTHELNIEIQKLIQKKLYNIDVPETPPGRQPKFLLHDKVIQTRNNYQTEVMNGSIGIITDIHENGTMIIEFENGPMEIKAGSENIKDIQLAYALSIYRCQGSEFPCTLVIIHKSHTFMHHRNLFYTGVTRAKHTAIIVGDHWGIRNCAQKQKVENRKTFLSYLLSPLSS